MLKVRRNIQMVFTVGPQSSLAEFPLTNSTKSLRGLERASKLASKADKLFTKKVVKNLKRNKCRRNKHHAKSSKPKLASFR